MKRVVLNETYISNLRTTSAKDYNGEPVYRIIGITEEDGRPQMYVIGIGARDEEDTNYFEPSIRSARYTTEESFLFLSEERAKAFFKRFKSEFDGDFHMKDFRVAQYHPFREILRLIPIQSPYGAAFIGEQKVEKKSYEEE